MNPRQSIIAAAITAAGLAGCASAPAADNHCLLQVQQRTEIRPGEFVTTTHCTAWEFGPSRADRERWERDHPEQKKP